MSSSISINGTSYEVNFTTLPADITLNTFIREHAGLTGTKFMCQEGGCGVCVCAVTGRHPATGEQRTWAVNSCLTLLNTCVGLEVTTSEGLGNKRTGYHPIQERLAKMNGTQCGYCSPGIVMNMYALLKANGGKVTMEEVENSFGGNICRCTGYRPILDAMKSFAVDSNIAVPAECADIEDLASKLCPKTGANCSGACKEAQQNGVHLLTQSFADGYSWYWPHTLAQVFEALASIPQDIPYMLVAGNTAHGVYRRSDNIKAFIDVNSVSELKSYRLSEQILTLGANLSLTETMQICRELQKTAGFEYLAQLWQHLDWIANVPVRNAGTLAGNLSIKHSRPEFPSDIYIAFEALDVKVIVQQSAKEQQIVSLSNYLQMPMQGKLIAGFVLRAYDKGLYLYDSYKIMPRAQNAHAYVNAAFLVGLDAKKQRVQTARICFGGINPNYTHAKELEQLLIGKELHDKGLQASIYQSLKSSLEADYVPPDANPAYRQQLAYSLFYKFVLKSAPQSKLSSRYITGASLLKRPVSTGQQSFETFEKNYPISKPTVKHEGLIQCSGEATYVNDLPTQHNQLWAAFVTAKKVGAQVSKIDATPALELPGVVAYFDAKDIPGVNVLGPKLKDAHFFKEEEQLFATGTIKFYHQPIGVILADSNALAQRAADLVQVSYEGGEQVELLPSLNDVLKSSKDASGARFEQKCKSMLDKLELVDPYDVTGSGELDMGLQYHFYMEPQTTVVLPFEGGLQVYVATQWMDLSQDLIANVLNLRSNEVQVKTRRIGGGYGGKATRCNMAAAAAALAAYKLNRPVRFVQSLESIMNTLGKRWAFHCDYDFYVQRTGKIVGLHSLFYEDAGYLSNESPIGHTVLLSKNCYEFSDNFKLDGYLVLTDSPSNTPCRAPGSVEGIAMMENIIEHIAFETGLDPADVRYANLLPAHKMGDMMPRFLESTKYRERRAEIIAYNKEHRWRKRGLGLCIMEYQIGYFGQYPATVAIYHSDGTVVVSHGGIEMGQGMNTKIAQVVAHTLGIPLEQVRIEGSDSINGANAMVTGGAVGSETLCFAVRRCCETLNERLAPIREEVKPQDWQQLITEAYNRKINLIVSDQCKQGDMDPYSVCGLCLNEVELDVLTGNYLITRVDLLEDTGESLNPNVDIGQIEGAFMMGLGYWTSEQIVVDKKTGECLTNRTWNYKPPGAKDIPIDLRIELLPNSPNKAGFMRSKATGEPAICLSISVAFALQQALQSARDDAKVPRSWVTLNAPMTPELLVLHAGTDMSMLQLD
ncbi:indole-3-acetaldehyde oxidase-like [Scaptodrosophila lebanonensis]|uniref:Indole-3-acetaldehyde oxidase-like n=1 Tax=Drosophila lebanonensis TaxID=7225 RepID=A0A6J2TEP5_DROLE|nr:indole-3-acetaldehyde oxidase-like [Scaptodrosophila lebanonensis]